LDYRFHPQKILKFVLRGKSTNDDCDNIVSRTSNVKSDSAAAETQNDATCTYERRGCCFCIITLTHPAGSNFDGYIAFKIKTTSPHRYLVRPNQGVVTPKTSTLIQVILADKKRRTSKKKKKRVGSEGVGNDSDSDSDSDCHCHCDESATFVLLSNNINNDKFLVQSSIVKNQQLVGAYIADKNRDNDMSKLTAVEFEELVGDILE